MSSVTTVHMYVGKKEALTVNDFFFFQAEDGIRDLTVTGVQTCALPIFRHADPHDDVMNAKMRDLHTMVSDLQSADEAALDQISDAAKTRARQLLAVVGITDRKSVV